MGHFLEKMAAAEESAPMEFSDDDKKRTGAIPIADMGTVLRSLGQNPTQTELAALCEEVDKDKSGTIEFDEFVDLMARTNKTQDDMDKEIIAAFRSFDVDGSGYLD